MFIIFIRIHWYFWESAGSKYSWKRKFQGTKFPGPFCSEKRKFYGAKVPGSERARERKG